MSIGPEAHEHAATRLVAFDARRPWALDVAIVAALVGSASVIDYGQGAASLAFTLGLSLPLLLRRRHPRIVFGLMALIALAQWIANVRALGDVALLVALYSVAERDTTRTTLGAFAVLEVGVVLATIRWAVVEPGKVAIGLTGLATAAAVIGMSVRGRRALVDSLHERAARLEYERDQQGRLSAAAERARIAREMHDIVAHHLSVMIALADGAQFQLEEAPERAADAMQTASRTGRQALTEMRRLLGILRDKPEPALSPVPGVEQIESLVERVRAAGVPVRYDVSGHPEELEPGLQLTAHRIVQEALTNTLKHAGEEATVEVRLACAPGELLVDVRDRAATAPGEPAAEGGGLRGMRERAAVYGGEVQAGPHPEGGWQVRTRLATGEPAAPLPARA